MLQNYSSFQVKKGLPKYAEIVFCAGFFIVYTADELVHLFCGEAITDSHNPATDRRKNSDSHNHNHNIAASSSKSRHYGSDAETQSLLGSETTHRIDRCSDNDEIVNAEICHANHEIPCEQNIFGVLGLLCALSLHSFLEGLAIGVQGTSNQVMLLLLAVSSHKFVVAFCLGVQLCTTANVHYKNHFISITIFSMGSVLGILLGLCMSFQNQSEDVTIPILQGLAGGTLLYVTVSEVLPREKARWHKKGENKAAGVIQLLSVACGFIVMTLLNLYLGELNQVALMNNEQ